MPITRQRTLDYVNIEWGTYVERFHRLPRAEQEGRMKAMGYESFRDMLAHILAWWDEGMGIIHAVAEGREFERKKYDFDVLTRRRWRSTNHGMSARSCADCQVTAW